VHYILFISKYRQFGKFVKININSLAINHESIIGGVNWTEPMLKLITQFDRDWKINHINNENI
jgi:hypothetical protein